VHRDRQKLCPALSTRLSRLSHLIDLFISCAMSYVPTASPPRTTSAFHEDDVIVTDVLNVRHTPSAHQDAPLMGKAVLRQRAVSRRSHTKARVSKTSTPMKRISKQVASHIPIKRKPTRQTRARIPSSSRVLSYVPEEPVTTVINNTRLKQPLICAALITRVCLTHHHDVSPSSMDEIL
jgi:hypothetical protein